MSKYTDVVQAYEDLFESLYGSRDLVHGFRRFLQIFCEETSKKSQSCSIPNLEGDYLQKLSEFALSILKELDEYRDKYIKICYQTKMQINSTCGLYIKPENRVDK